MRDNEFACLDLHRGGSVRPLSHAGDFCKLFCKNLALWAASPETAPTSWILIDLRRQVVHVTCCKRTTGSR